MVYTQETFVHPQFIHLQDEEREKGRQCIYPKAKVVAKHG